MNYSDAENISEIERQLKAQEALSSQLKQQIAMLESLAKQKMSREAVSRYGSLKLAHPETAIKAIAMIAQAVQAGQLRETLTDEDFRTLLKNIQEGKQTYNFRR